MNTLDRSLPALLQGHLDAGQDIELLTAKIALS
jgi:hypothetical protein